MVIRFEDLIGPKGGGDAKMQYSAIHSIAKALGQDLKQDQIESIGKEMFGSSKTFRKGKIGSWIGQYNERNLFIFYLRFGRYQKALGY